MPKAILFEQPLRVQISISGAKGAGKSMLARQMKDLVGNIVQDHFEVGVPVTLQLSDGEKTDVWTIRAAREAIFETASSQ